MPRILSLYTKLTSLKVTEDETFTDYIVKTKAIATSLKTAGEMISDSLLTAMILKGLPQEYKMFREVIGQKTLTFFLFKMELRAFKELEKSYTTQARGESVMEMKDKHKNPMLLT